MNEWCLAAHVNCWSAVCDELFTLSRRWLCATVAHRCIIPLPVSQQVLPPCMRLSTWMKKYYSNAALRANRIDADIHQI